jgi:hypothetical protein
VELNLGQIVSLATTLNQGRLDLTTSEMSLYANMALGEVATRIQHQPLQGIAVSSTTSGENRIALPSDFDFVLNITLSDSSAGPVGAPVLLQARREDWLDSAVSTVGVPRWYTPYADWIELSPPPDSAYSVQLRYGKKIRAMTELTDTPELAERYHMAVMYKTAEIAAAMRNDLEQQAVRRGDYLSYMQSTPSDLAYRQRAEEGMGVAYVGGPRRRR